MGGGGGWVGEVGSKGKRGTVALSLFTGCFLNGPKVIFLKNTANSVLSQKSWRSSNTCGSTTRQPDWFGTEWKNFCITVRIQLLYIVI